MQPAFDLAALRRFVDGCSSVRLAILFGSTARGTNQAASDLDVAFEPEDLNAPLADELALQADLERATGRAVDLVRLDRASTFLRWRIAAIARHLG